MPGGPRSGNLLQGGNSTISSGNRYSGPISPSRSGELGSLLDHSGSIGRAEKYAAKVFGADRTYFVTNGTSTANKIVFYRLHHGRGYRPCRQELPQVDRACGYDDPFPPGVPHSDTEPVWDHRPDPPGRDAAGDSIGKNRSMPADHDR